MCASPAIQTQELKATYTVKCTHSHCDYLIFLQTITCAIRISSTYNTKHSIRVALTLLLTVFCSLHRFDQSWYTKKTVKRQKTSSDIDLSVKVVYEKSSQLVLQETVTSLPTTFLMKKLQKFTFSFLQQSCFLSFCSYEFALFYFLTTAAHKCNVVYYQLSTVRTSNKHLNEPKRTHFLLHYHKKMVKELIAMMFTEMGFLALYVFTKINANQWHLG